MQSYIKPCRQLKAYYNHNKRRVTRTVSRIIYCGVVGALSVFVHYAYAQNNQKQTTALSFASGLPNLSSDDAAVLRTGAALSSSTQRNDKVRLRYTPRVKKTDRVRTFVEQTRPTILYETLYFIAEQDHARQSEIMAQLYNYFRDIQTLPEIRYRNIKKNVIYPVFLSSIPVVSKEDITPLPPLTPVTPARISTSGNEHVAVLQDMPPFGDVVSRYEYNYDNVAAEYWGENITPVFYKNVQAVKPHHMLSAAYIIRTDEGVVVYGIGAVRVTGVAVLFKGIIANSFESRMVGLFTWIKNRYEGKPQLQ